MEISARLADGSSATPSAMVRAGGRSRGAARRRGGRLARQQALGGLDGGLRGLVVGGRDGDDEIVRAGRLGLVLEQAGRGHDRAVGGGAHQQRGPLDAVELLELGGDAHQLDGVAVGIAADEGAIAAHGAAPVPKCRAVVPRVQRQGAFVFVRSCQRFAAAILAESDNRLYGLLLRLVADVRLRGSRGCVRDSGG